MSRCTQASIIILGWSAVTVLALALALAWGPHHDCKPAFPMVIGCAIGNYENLTAGMIAAGAALFAGWLAWSAVQVQILAEERRAAAEKLEVEAELQNDLDYLAEGLATLWRILQSLAGYPDSPHIEDTARALNGVAYGIEKVAYGIEKIADETHLETSRKMVTVLGWKQRRQYEALFDALERLRAYRDINNFDVSDAEYATNRAANWIEVLRSDTTKYFGDIRFRPAKTWTLGRMITNEAGFDLELGRKFCGD